MACRSSTTAPHAYTNALVHEKSPYLLQHAHNPVDWHPWGPKALEKAQKENKLLIVSIGYSSCHWCHVMEEESFADTEVAEYMNAHYVSIKVDREERPDVDQIYMDAALLMRGQGGWPLNALALPDGRPIFVGTYYPKAQWMQLLSNAQDYYAKDSAALANMAETLAQGLRDLNAFSPLLVEKADAYAGLTAELLTLTRSQMDSVHGGQLGAPKFPMPRLQTLLLDVYHGTKDAQLERVLHKTLEEMAGGGMYDQLGGGFARYSTDEAWTVPHFEKMLYDNAQLMILYSRAYRLFAKPLYKQVVEQTAAFLERELFFADKGLFYAALDADSEGEEGTFYLWHEDDIDAVLGADSKVFKYHYGVTRAGDLEGKNVLTARRTVEETQKVCGCSPSELQALLERAQQRLLAVRNQRERPSLDDHVLSAWNALAVMGYAEAYMALGDPKYLKTALRVGDYFSSVQRAYKGLLPRTPLHAKDKWEEGFLDDYAFLALAYIRLYEVTFDESWLALAQALKKEVVAHFSDSSATFFHYTSDRKPVFITRKVDVQDNVIPSPNAAMAWVLYTLGKYYGDTADIKRAERMLSHMEERVRKQPFYYNYWAALALHKQSLREVVLAGSKAAAFRRELLGHYTPHILLLGMEKDKPRLPLLENKWQAGATYVYVCTEGTCKLPVQRVADALKQLQER